jgi:acetyl esterase/lipase
MVALATGAVAASGSPFESGRPPQYEPADATASSGSSATSSAIAVASCDPTLDQKEDAAEKAAKASANPSASMAPEASEPPICKAGDHNGGVEKTADPSSKPTAKSTPRPTAASTASCDPTLDQKEDAAEKAAKASLAPGTTLAPEASEPPHCAPAGNKGEGAGDKDGDSNANQNGISGHNERAGISGINPKFKGKAGGPSGR